MTTRPTANRRCASDGCDRPLTLRWIPAICPDCHAAANPAKERPGTRQVLVYTPSMATVPQFTRVTLPAAPWEMT